MDNWKCLFIVYFVLAISAMIISNRGKRFYDLGVTDTEKRLEAEYEEVSKHWLKYYEGCNKCKGE